VQPAPAARPGGFGVTRFALLGLREFRSNWRRNAVFGAILLIAVTTQLITALTTTASQIAVQTYGTAIYGYARTYSAQVSRPLDPAETAVVNQRLITLSRQHPWFRAATVVALPLGIDATGGQDPRTVRQITARAMSPAWREFSPAIADDDVWRTVTSPDRLGPALMLDTDIAAQLQITGPTAVSVLDEISAADATGTAETAGQNDLSSASSASSAEATGDVSSTGPQEQAGGAAGPRRVLRNVPVFGLYREPNKTLAADALVNQNLLTLLDAGPQPVSLFWRCDPSTCADAVGLARAALGAVRAVPVGTLRVDQIDQFTPVLRQQSVSGKRFSAIVLILGALAVTIVSTAFVEVRAPQFATLRTLGASRSVVAGIALLETFLTAVVVAVISVLLGIAATRFDPNRLNQIPEVRLTELDVPVDLFARTVLLTLGVGLLTGLSPAVRAYRSVRTS
jgi:hypothetical protein